MPTILSKKAAIKLTRITTTITGRIATTKSTRLGMTPTIPVRTSVTGVRFTAILFTSLDVGLWQMYILLSSLGQVMGHMYIMISTYKEKTKNLAVADVQKVRYTNKFMDCDLTAENAIAFRRLVGQEKKNRIPVRMMIEAELIEAAGCTPRSGELSDLVNMGLNMILVQTGKL